MSIMIIQDSDGAYYWHILSGTIQRDPPTVGEADTQVRGHGLSQNWAGGKWVHETRVILCESVDVR